MIPKIIHYCWFGGKPLPKLAEKCIASWKKYCPDYEIKRWDETNFDVHCNKYVEQAYEAKKWAFVSDFARLSALVKEGGIYLDTDVELLSSLTPCLESDAFLGFETKDSIGTCIIGSIPDFVVFKDFYSSYEGLSFVKEDGSLDTTTNVKRLTEFLQRYDLIFNNEFQQVQDIHIYPSDYFCPKNPYTLKTTLTDKTVAIHHFDGSWLPLSSKILIFMTSIFGKKFYNFLLKFKKKMSGSK